ncbi:putative choline kinase [Spiroplasma litorale]|uniref:Putative choline kinase n=1 Tax=Spiroplasma litorale TaxID=216942 RepID=A0A0K1W1N6_9MOLU|nr:phosphotransferase [Spiroplasma litorale]AKX34007.1 putative choline kinase [Spiroplasma litorale]
MEKNTYIGLTNKIKVKNDLIIKNYKIKKNDYLDKKNEFEVLNVLKSIDQNVIIKAEKMVLKKTKLISYFKILEGYLNLSNVEIEDFHVRKVTELINSFHKIKDERINSLKQFNYKSTLDYFYKKIKKPFFNLDKYYKNIVLKIDTVKGLKKVLSHNDLVPGNIMFKDDDFILIDYDFITLNDKFFDYASFITETLNDNEENIKIFINQLIKKRMILLDKSELDKLNFVIKYQDLLWTLWANYMYENKGDEIYKEIYSNKFDRLKNRKPITF